MIPGPIELSPAVISTLSNAPPSHVAADLIEKFGACLRMMREIWQAGADSQPFILAGSGTIGMDMAVANVVQPGQRVLVVHTGFFSARIAEMLRRRGAQVNELETTPGSAPTISAIEAEMDAADAAGQSYTAVFATHVDTSTGVRVGAEAIARAARQREILSIFDGVCAAAAEQFDMQQWGADVYLTASQKAIGAPPGLALMVFSARALEARRNLTTPPPMSVDVEQWLPIMQAYEAGRPSYFSTPATGLIAALHASLSEITAFQHGANTGIAARVAAHQRLGEAMRAAWRTMQLKQFGDSPHLAANTISAILYPDGVDASLLAAIRARGVIVAGGLYPGRQQDYFRVGHMGYVVERPDLWVKTVRAIGEALVEKGYPARVDDALAAVESFAE